MASDGRWYPPEQHPERTSVAESGWWQASDGKWYPPDQHPSRAASTLPVPPAPPSVPSASAHPPGWWQASDGRWYPPQPGPSQPAAAPGSFTPQPQAVSPPPTGRGVTFAAAIIGAMVILAGIAYVATRDSSTTAVDVSPPITAGPAGDDEAAEPRVGDEDEADGSTSTQEDFDEGVVGGESQDDPSPSPSTTEAFDSSFPGPSDPVEVNGNNGEPWNVASAFALGNIEDFWRREFPAVFGAEYEPISGGFYAYSSNEPVPPCARNRREVANNAYYCGLDDVVAWDDEQLFPGVHDFAGDLGVGLILAHEIGHAIQERVGMVGRTVTFENQADCYAGAWVKSVEENPNDNIPVTSGDLDLALAQFVQIADTPGTAATDPFAHGNAFDRVNGFRDGLENGALKCAGYTDSNIVITQVEFGSLSDQLSGGNLPYLTSDEGDDIFDLMPADLELFWEFAFTEEVGTWDPIDGSVVTFSDGDALPCGDNDVDLLAFYCATDDYIGIETDTSVRQLYDEFGDFGPGVIIAAQYGFAIQSRLGVAEDRLLNSLQADCYAGVWTASILPTSDRVFDDTETAPNRRTLSISPGDLDEAVETLLILGDPTETDDNRGTGFERVGAFREGVLGGITGCSRFDPN